MSRRIAVFGSTGSIGKHTLDLVRGHLHDFDVVALTAGRNIPLLRSQVSEFKPRAVVVEKAEDARELSREFTGLEVLHGEQGLVQCARWGGIDLAVQGIMGFAALASTLELAKRGCTLALANKEALVVAGSLLKEQMRSGGALCIPVDSEHNAIYQLLIGRERSSVETLVLTASGGPFWRQPDLDLRSVTPEQAIKHPNWKMGPKISVDSATLMNKGLEVVEAQVLFDTPADQIEVWIHPQSIVHGAVWFTDGTCQAQLSRPDMKASIGYALGYPQRLAGSVPRLSLPEMRTLEFTEPDRQRFPALDLPRQALASGQSALIALNAGNELAVAAFLEGRIGFHQIAQVLDQLLQAHTVVPVSDLDAVMGVDRQAREKMLDIIAG